MCKSAKDGGQRCASHARVRYARQAEALARSDGSAYRDAPWAREGRERLEVDWQRAATEYASTPEGQEVLAAEADAAPPEHQARLRNALVRGAAMRQANTEAAARIRAGEPPAPLLPPGPPRLFTPQDVEAQQNQGSGCYGYRHRDWYTGDEPYELREVPIGPLAADVDETVEFVNRMEGRTGRRAEDRSNIARLARMYRAGQDVNPPVVHMRPDGTIEVLDGTHRVPAAVKAGRQTMLVLVNRGERKTR